MDSWLKNKILKKLQDRNKREVEGFADLIHARKKLHNF